MNKKNVNEIVAAHNTFDAQLVTLMREEKNNEILSVD